MAKLILLIAVSVAVFVSATHALAKDKGELLLTSKVACTERLDGLGKSMILVNDCISCCVERSKKDNNGEVKPFVITWKLDQTKYNLGGVYKTYKCECLTLANPSDAYKEGEFEKWVNEHHRIRAEGEAVDSEDQQGDGSN